MKATSLSLILIAAAACAERAPESKQAALDTAYTMMLDGPDNDQLPADVTVIQDEYTYYEASVAFQGRNYHLQFSINPDGSRIIHLLDETGGAVIDATENGSVYSLMVTVAGATTIYSDSSPPIGPGVPDTVETAALLIAFDIPDELEWIDDPVTDSVAATDEYGGGRHGRRAVKPKVPKPRKGTEKTCPKPGRGTVIVAGCAVLLTLCLGTELTCQGPQDFHCPDGRIVHDPCGCGQSICNKCFGTCSDECAAGGPKCD